MDKQQAKNRIVALSRQIEDLRYRYHVLNDPTVTDDVKDALEKELRALEAAYPDLALKDSPLVRVAGKPLEKFEKVEHDVRMLSLNDVFSKEELREWAARVKKNLAAASVFQPPTYFAEVKFDGLAVSLIYQQGFLVKGATRGDGLIGEDITQNLKTIESIPLRLRGKHFPEFIEIRGEAVMPKKVLEALNQKQARENKPLFANTRNAAAGSLRQLDPTLTAERKLDFFAYDIADNPHSPGLIHNRNFNPDDSHSGLHEALRILGFKTLKEYEFTSDNLEQIEEFIDRFEKIRPNLPFGTDGVVVSVNELRLQQVLGVVGKAPRYMAAYKYPAEKATTVVKEIKVSVGRTGVLTPLAVFEPTQVAGSIISRATLHNSDQIERLGLRVGDTVVIQKAGDVIPEVVQVLPGLRTGKEKKFKMPDHCPVCGFKVEKRQIANKKQEVSTAHYCSNPRCPAKNRRFMEHFVNVLEIYEIGPKILDRFQAEGLISDAADLFALRKEDIVGLDRFGEKSAENILASLAAHKKIPLSRFIYALGILHVGEQTAEDLAAHFGSLEKLRRATREEINQVENIGPVVSESVFEYFHNKDNLKFIEKLFAAGVLVQPYKKPLIDAKLAKKIFVITGTLAHMGRKEAKVKIKRLGGRVSESVSKNTSYVIVGKNPGSKLQQAQQLGIKILSESEFLKLLG